MFAHVSIYYSYLLTKHKLQIAPSTFHVLGFFFAVLSFKINRVDILCWETPPAEDCKHKYGVYPPVCWDPGRMAGVSAVQ